ncbi:uncharacterized protein B0H18DRAFT_1002590 [Fomitopsis serialis]|uniref:uncharacterized protein n=1 Tax=Fomitopsis serialis TaxID=139415 RepID=UPI0020081C9B|nr:uncharacterized protein B0H18DRAFT_1002590 [Neoantrodia serialis]KAH9927582.1 hypothetical protein B0H18DRAFT_1002590 [Neoantrodia serialis]
MRLYDHRGVLIDRRPTARRREDGKTLQLWTPCSPPPKQRDDPPLRWIVKHPGRRCDRMRMVPRPSGSGAAVRTRTAERGPSVGLEDASRGSAAARRVRGRLTVSHGRRDGADPPGRPKPKCASEGGGGLGPAPTS